MSPIVTGFRQHKTFRRGPESRVVGGDDQGLAGDQVFVSGS